MGEILKSNLTGENYDINNVLRILNYQQVIFYCRCKIYPIDIYDSVDYKTGKPNLVYIYEKTETMKNAYIDWCSRKEEAQPDE